MLSSDLKTVVAPLTRTMTIIWGAFISATVVYLLMAWIMFGMNPVDTVPNAETSPTVLRPVFGVVGFLLVVGSIFMERYWFSGRAIMEKLAGTPDYEKLSTQKGGMTPSREAFEKLSESEQKLVCLVPYFQTGMIIIWAMREAVAVMGLVLVILEKDFMVAIPFTVGAALLIAIKAPRPVAFLERVRGLPGTPI